MSQAAKQFTKEMKGVLDRYYRSAMSEAIKAGIRHKREMQSKQIQHD